MLAAARMTLGHAARATLFAWAVMAAAPAASSDLLSLTPADKFVVAAYIDDIGSLDPAEAYEFSTADMLANVYDTLVIEDPTAEGGFRPGLAESWEISADGRVFSFQLRQGVTFASLNPVTAADAAFSLQRLLALDHAPASILKPLGLTGANAAERIRDDDGRLVLALPEPVAPGLVLSILSTTATAVVDSRIVLDNAVLGDLGNRWLSAATAGSGPYALETFTRGVDYVLTARQDHWSGAAGPPRVRVHHVPDGGTQRSLLEAGLIDVARNIPAEDLARLELNPAIRVEASMTGEIVYLAANMAHPVLSQPPVIEALRWLVDYQSIASTPSLAGGRIVHQAFLPRGVPGALEDRPFHLDVDRARTLLQDAGISQLDLRLLVRDVEDRLTVARTVRDSFAQAGITIEIDARPGDEVLSTYRARDHELVLEAWIPEYADPHFNAAAFAGHHDDTDAKAATGSLAWRNGYVPGEVGDMVNAAFDERDTQARLALYREIQHAHRRSAPFIIMFQKIEQNAMLEQVSGFSAGGITGRATFSRATK